jgi:hypothetical protein
MEIPFTPTENFKKLSKDLHEIRVSLILSGFEKALEMKKCIASFLRSVETTPAERAKVEELLLKLRDSESRKNLSVAQKRSGVRN